MFCCKCDAKQRTTYLHSPQEVNECHLFLKVFRQSNRNAHFIWKFGNTFPLLSLPNNFVWNECESTRNSTLRIRFYIDSMVHFGRSSAHSTQIQIFTHTHNLTVRNSLLWHCDSI